MKKRWGIVLLLGLGAAGLVVWLSTRDDLEEVVKKGLQGIGILTARLREQGVPAVRLWIRDHALRLIQGVSPADTSRIAPGLFVGGQQYCYGLPRMAALNLTASVSLRREADDAARGVALERHLWLPTVDDTPPTLEQLDQGARFIHEALNDGRGVYVHCASGVGRAPTTAAAYLVRSGLTPAEAWTLIRDSRPFIRPKESQIEQIERFSEWDPGF